MQGGKRFSLLMLEAEERYLSDVGVMHSPMVPAPHHPLPHVRGRLRICTKSIFFEPDPLDLPILRIPLKHVTGVETVSSVPAQGSRITKKEPMFRVQTSMLTSMRADNKPSPYKQHNMDQEHVFTALHSSLDSFLPLIMQLLASSRLSFEKSEELLGTIYSEHCNRFVFEFSCLHHGLQEHINFQSHAQVQVPLVAVPGRVVITDKRIYFQPFSHLFSKEVFGTSLQSIRNVIPRKHCHRPLAIEVQLKDDLQAFDGLAPITISVAGYSSRSSMLFIFEKKEDRERALQGLNGLNVGVSLHQTDVASNLLVLQSAWRERKISNFDYLLAVNFAAGRSFNDLAKYPVMPWIIADYHSLCLDLNNPNSFRDLSKPIGALNEQRLSNLKARFNEMPEPKFLYGTHYSTPGYVVHFLVRIYPDLMLHLQRGKFDDPDRTFSSISNSFRSVYTNPADVKELIPEFFSDDTSFLLNTLDLDLGCKQNSLPVADVELPLWASDASDFLRQNREALESEHVSKSLHLWIDLIFGCKQQGEAAIAADNVFHPWTYEDKVDWEEHKDEVGSKALLQQIQEFGQCPDQIFLQEHPSRNSPPVSLQEEQDEISLDRHAEAACQPIYTQEESGEQEVSRRQDDGSAACVRWPAIASMASAGTLRVKDTITGVCFGREEDELISVSHDATLRLFTMKRMEQLRCFTIGQLALSCVELFPGQATTDLVLAGSWDPSIYLFSLEYGRVVQEVKCGHEDAVSSLAVSSERTGPTLLASGSWDATVKTWSFLPNGLSSTPVSTVCEHETEVKQVKLSSTGTLGSSLSADGHVALWDVRAAREVKWSSRPQRVTSLCFAGANSMVMGRDDGVLEVVDVRASMDAAFFTLHLGAAVNCVESDGRQWVAGDAEGKLTWGLLDGRSGPGTCHSLRATEDGVTTLAVKAGGSRIAAGGEENAISLWDTKSA